LRNRLRAQLEDGQVEFGINLGIGSCEVPYSLGEIGLDWVNFDTQHSILDTRAIASMIQAMSYSKTVPIIRVLSNDVGLINKALDIGAQAVIVPMVNTRAEAEKAVRSARYKSPGLRSWGARAAIRDPEYAATADSEIMVIPQIETQLALKNLEEIVTADGIDAVFCGPSDLSMSLGVFGKFDNPSFQKAVESIVSTCEAHDVTPGLLAPAGNVEKSIQQGFKLISLGQDLSMLTQAVANVLKAARACVTSAKH
jgi:4-hydroxy-2-oxoheptanedioate aldolase